MEKFKEYVINPWEFKSFKIDKIKIKSPKDLSYEDLIVENIQLNIFAHTDNITKSWNITFSLKKLEDFKNHQSNINIKLYNNQFIFEGLVIFLKYRDGVCVLQNVENLKFSSI